MCGGFVSHELETQAGPSRILLEISLLEHNRLEGENEGRMQNNADTSCGDRDRERGGERPDGTTPWVPFLSPTPFMLFLQNGRQW